VVGSGGVVGGSLVVMIGGGVLCVSHDKRFLSEWSPRQLGRGCLNIPAKIPAKRRQC